MYHQGAAFFSPGRRDLLLRSCSHQAKRLPVGQKPSSLAVARRQPVKVFFVRCVYEEDSPNYGVPWKIWLQAAYVGVQMFSAWR